MNFKLINSIHGDQVRQRIIIYKRKTQFIGLFPKTKFSNGRTKDLEKYSYEFA